jgi:hypothetical protein
MDRGSIPPPAQGDGLILPIGTRVLNYAEWTGEAADPPA